MRKLKSIEHPDVNQIWSLPTDGGIGTACAQPGDVLAWIECHAGLAGYLQFIGVLLAIAIAVWTTYQSLRPSARERSRRANVLIYRLLAIVSEIVKATVRIKRAVAENEHGFALAAAGQLEIARWAFRIDAQIAADILAELHVLDGALPESVAQLYYYEAQYNDFIDRNVPHLREYDAATRAKFIDTFDTLFGTVEHLAATLRERLQALHERLRDAPVD